MVFDRLGATAPSRHCRCPRGAGGAEAGCQGIHPACPCLPLARQGEPRAAGGEMERKDKKEMAWSERGWRGRESSARPWFLPHRSPGAELPPGRSGSVAPAHSTRRAPSGACLTRRGAVQPCCSCRTNGGNWSQLKPPCRCGSLVAQRGPGLRLQRGSLSQTRV